MNTKYFYTFLFLFLVTTSFAQDRKLHFSISGGGIMVPSSSISLNRAIDFLMFEQIDEETGVNFHLSGERESSLSYKSHLAYYMELKRHLDYKKSGIVIGIGFSKKRHDVFQNHLLTNQVRNVIDTISIVPPVERFGECTYHSNTFEDLGELKTPLDIFNLYLLVHYRYQLIPNKLSLHVGIQMQTSRIERQQRFIRRDELDYGSQIVCSWSFFEPESVVRDLFFLTIFKWDTRLNYQISPTLAVDLGVNKQLDPTALLFIDPNSTSVERWYRPLSFTVGLSYHFNVKW